MRIETKEREPALTRWEKFVTTHHIIATYQPMFTGLDFDTNSTDIACLMVIETAYVKFYENWERENITDNQYNTLKNCVNPTAHFVIIRYHITNTYNENEIKDIISRIKSNTFELSEADVNIFYDTLNGIYKTAIDLFFQKLSDNQNKITAELDQLFSKIEWIYRHKPFNDFSEPEIKSELKLERFICELNKTTDIFLNSIDEAIEAYNSKNKVQLNPWTNTANGTNILLKTSHLEKTRAYYADNFLMNLTKAAQNIGEITECKQVYGYIVSPTKGKNKPKKERIVSVMLSALDSGSVKLTRPITIIDRAIIEAIETLAPHNKYITAAEVYRMMNGGENIKLRSELIEEIESRIDYMRQIMTTVDYTQHMNMNGHKGSYIREDTLLNLAKVKVSLNGKNVTAYEYNKISPLFKYALDVGQIASIPVAMFNTKGGQKGGIRAQAIRHYLLQRLYTIKGQSTTVKLETLLENIGEPKPSIDQLKRIRAIIENFLELWSYGKLATSKAAPDKAILEISPIIGFEPITSKRKITGYRLIPRIISTAQLEQQKKR